MHDKTISLVVFDLAGTVVDFGSRAPAGAFCELFRRHGITATECEARVPMGMHKRDHIAEMLRMPSIAEQWRDKYHRDWSVMDVDMLFREFLPLQLDALPTYADPIPGAAETILALGQRGVKTAATTGYNREMTSFLVGALAPHGVVFDFTCCAAEVPSGRPSPWMIHRCMEALNVFPPRRVINIGDTMADVRAGVNAGVWTVGVTMTGNMVGLPKERVDSLSAEKAEFFHRAAEGEMRESGADLVLESVAALPRALDAIEYDCRQGKLPGMKNTRRTEPALNRLLEKTSVAMPSPAMSLR